MIGIENHLTESFPHFSVLYYSDTKIACSKQKIGIFYNAYDLKTLKIKYVCHAEAQRVLRRHPIKHRMTSFEVLRE